MPSSFVVLAPNISWQTCSLKAPLLPQSGNNCLRCERFGRLSHSKAYITRFPCREFCRASCEAEHVGSGASCEAEQAHFRASREAEHFASVSGASREVEHATSVFGASRDVEHVVLVSKSVRCPQHYTGACLF